MDHRVISQVKKVIRKWPAYRSYVEERLPDPLGFDNLDELPIIDKEFISRAIHTVPLCKVRNIIPSSGSTGIDFSFGLFGCEEIRRSSGAMESFLQGRFNTDTRKTLLLNLLPGSVPLFSQTVAVASIGTRADTAISALRSLGSSFEQIILAGEPLFIKKLIEYGMEQSIVWRYLPLFIVAGGEWMSESYRRYIEGKAGAGRLFSSMGMAELGLNYFFETDETMLFRKMIWRDSRLLKALFGDVPFCPMIFSYNEQAVIIETIREEGEYLDSIILTTVDSDRVLPLIRYNGGDKGMLLPRGRINDALRNLGYRVFGDTGLPVLAHFGRGRNIAGIYPERLKEILYSSDDTASGTTGNFRLEKGHEMAHLDIQLGERVYSAERLGHIYRQAFRELPVRVRLYPFERFPYALSFERKVQYVGDSEGCGYGARKKDELPVEV